MATNPQGKAKGGKKHRKHDRNKVKCERYRREGRREKNKARRQAKIQRRLDKRRMKRGL